MQKQDKWRLSKMITHSALFLPSAISTFHPRPSALFIASGSPGEGRRTRSAGDRNHHCRRRHGRDRLDDGAAAAFAANLQEEQRSWFDRRSGRRRRDKFRPRQLLTYLRPGKTKSATAETIYGDGRGGKKQQGRRKSKERKFSFFPNDDIEHQRKKERKQ